MWARTGERGKFHAFDQTNDGFEQLCTEDHYDDLGDDTDENPEVELRCKRCHTQRERQAKDQKRQKADAAVADAGPPRPTDVKKVKVGDQVRAAFLVNGPRLFETGAWVQKVHARKDGPPLLDLKTEGRGNHPSMRLVGVPWRSEPQKVLKPNGSTSWRLFG